MDGICKCCHGLFRRFFGSSMKKGIFIYAMRLVVCLLNICPFYVANYEMIEYIQERYGATFVVLASNITKKMKTLKGVTCIEIPRSLLETVHRRRHENS